MIVNPDPKFTTLHVWVPVCIQDPLLEAGQILRRGPISGVHDNGSTSAGVGLTKSGVQLTIQHTIALALHLFPDKEATINRTLLVEINNCMGNKHAFANKASWEGLKEDPVEFWDFFKRI